ncbi:hypothetical protein OF66_1058 [Seleniivibrio woodruffii]|uniref:Glycosyl hydrolase family 67 n=1 Tax=Seleniivibrio woodruffii TaxID=1078050 RepID=A0A4R1K5P2_9BACT|nr:hypothetical protein C8D98_2450 [Seleniivibrio woodruffii]TVZ35443.1 hypothetical protein OF66_1058 [Seleniivibrio woodruffii]
MSKSKLILTFFFIFLFLDANAAQNRINFYVPSELLSDTSVNIALADAGMLLKQSFPHTAVSINEVSGNVNIRLNVRAVRHKLLHKPPFKVLTKLHGYHVTSASIAEGAGVTVTITAETPQGIVNGIYGLLQHKLGFRFYHPKDTYVPIYEKWPLPSRFDFSGEPVFAKRGFHMHTMHPVELTEPLFDPDVPFGTDEVKQYIDWLVRNGQNVFQFWVLRTADRTIWPEYASQYIRYAKARGLETGAVISLSTLQQKAFQAMEVLRPESYEKQIDRNIGWLMQVPFDYVCIDFTMGEFLPDLAVLMPDKKRYIMELISKKYHRKVFENTHVIKRRHSETPSYAGMLIHSVMFYGLADSKAPVYGNENIRFMYDLLLENKDIRETWYWPESSYWVTFDTSVPLFLLPYLKSRYEDIELLKDDGAAGHVTFTSGWEWGYWLIDYSIARFTWHLYENGRELKVREDFALTELFGKDSVGLWHKAVLIQEKYLKNGNLIALMAAKTPFEEMPYPFNRTFQPTSGSFSVVKAALPVIGDRHRERMKKQAALLDEFWQRFSAVTDKLENMHGDTEFMKDTLRAEIINGMRVTALRAKHRELTLLAAAHRNTNLRDSSEYYVDSLLSQAADIRKKAETIVRQQELIYRYPLSLIARKTSTHTSYTFGYLYPVSDLYFWKREEEQVKVSRFDAFFMNIWNFTKTLGLDGLF